MAIWRNGNWWLGLLRRLAWGIAFCYWTIILTVTSYYYGLDKINKYKGVIFDDINFTVLKVGRTVQFFAGFAT